MKKLLFVIIVFAIVSCQSGSQKAQSDKTATESVQVAETTVNIGGMSCENCVASVEKGIKELEGITSVTVSLADSNAVVSFDPAKVDIEKIQNAIEGRGYSVKPTN